MLHVRSHTAVLHTLRSARTLQSSPADQESKVDLIKTMLPPKKRQENRQSQEVSDPIPDRPAGDHLDDVQEPIPEPSDDTLSDSSSGSSLEPGSESQMFHQNSPPSPRVRRDVGLWNPMWKDPIDSAKNLKIKKEEDEEDDIAVDEIEDERPRAESDEDTGSRSSPGSGSNLPHDQAGLYRNRQLLAFNGQLLRPKPLHLPHLPLSLLVPQLPLPPGILPNMSLLHPLHALQMQQALQALQPHLHPHNIALPVPKRGSSPPPPMSLPMSLPSMMTSSSTSSSSSASLRPRQDQPPIVRRATSSRPDVNELGRRQRDQQRARALGLEDDHTEKIIQMSMEEFNEFCQRRRFDETQINELRDMRRRGKNKVAAQNCRKRKLMTIDDLQKQVSEEQARQASLKKEQTELIQNKENMLERASFLVKKLKTTKNEVVKCTEHENYTEKCFETSSCEMRFCLST